MSVSVLALVPDSVLRPWLAIEAYARDKSECWPSNRALQAMMGAGSIRAAQAMLERLGDYGIVERRQLPGNRRILVLVRRVAAELSATEWDAMASQASRRAEGRTAIAAAKTAARKAAKAARPKLRIVS